MGQVIKANFKAKAWETKEDEFDFRASVAVQAVKRCRTRREELLLQAEIEALALEAEEMMRKSSVRAR